MNTIFTNPTGTGRRTGLETDIGTSITNRMNGVNPSLSNLFTTNNEATAAQGAQAKQDLNGSMFGQGAASRNNAAVNSQNQQAVSKNLLGEAQQQAQDQNNATTQGQSWNQQMTNKDQQAYENAYGAAKDTGDTVTQAGLGQIALGNAGDTTTDYGQQQLTKQANEQSANAAQQKSYEDQVRDLQLQQLRNSVKASQGSTFGDIMNYVGQGTKAASSVASLAALL